ncbi:MAG TPA: DEAD/DEAH box helicase [Thermoanaerobaculia bacterium]|nr:DEAD/DEAH box helicase [Thermoanaerobaculia bacterium]
MAGPPGKFGDHLSDVYFADLKLPHAVSAGIAACGFVRATPVQAATLPLLLAGKDVAAQAQTGTGKTAAFLIAIFARLARTKRAHPSPYPRALAVAPTRELAIQIQEDAKALGHFLKPRIVTVFGGIDYVRQRDQLRAGCDLLVGTPGRLLDYEQQGATSFGEVESLVIDEADRLFDLGFIRDLRRILRRCPPPSRRHSMMFSATLSLRVMELAYEHLNDAVKVEIRPEHVTADRVTQVLYHVSQREKMPLLLGLLRRESAAAPRGEPLRTLLFVNTKRFAERLVGTLERHGWKIGALTGDIPQARRMKILADFKNGTLPLLVATDVASRGLHIEGVTHVINVDLPQDPEDYVHRIGRTARAGRTGKAISLADEDYVFSLDAIQRLIGMKIPVEFADDKLFSPGGATPKVEKAETPAAPSAPTGEKTAPHAPKISSKVKREEAPPAPEVPSKVEETAARPRPRPEREPVAAAPPAFEEIPPSPSPVPSLEKIPSPLSLSSPLSSLAESSSESPVSLLAADFWTREAFGLEAPEGGFGEDVPEAPPPGSTAAAPAKRRRRRRGRRVAPRAEAAAPA